MKLNLNLKKIISPLILLFFLTTIVKAEFTDPIINCPPEGNVVACNSTILQLSGYNVVDPIIANSIGLSATPGAGSSTVTLSGQLIQSTAFSYGEMGFVRFRFTATDENGNTSSCIWRLNVDFTTDIANCTNDLSFSPNNLADPLNKKDGSGRITHFHKELTVSTGVPGQTIQLVRSKSNFLDASLSIIPSLTNLGTTDGTGTLKYNFFIPAGTSERILVSNGFTVPNGYINANENYSSGINISDPCNCMNPKNIMDGRDIAFFHDVLRVEAGPNEPVTLTANSGVFLTNSPTPVPVPTSTVLGTTDANGVLEVEFYHEHLVAGNISISTLSGFGSFAIDACSSSSCVAPIPTMSQWGLLIFGLLVLNLGLIFLQGIIVKIEPSKNVD